MSETAKYRKLVVKYCKGNGADVGSGGDPVVPSAIQVELPLDEYSKYRSGDIHGSPIQWHGDGTSLPFKDRTLDYLFSSHLLEDFLNWKPVLQEWVRVLKKGGHLIIMVPDKERWNYAVQHLKQPVNCSHKHEATVGELSSYAKWLGLQVLEDRLTECHPHDYNILFVAKRI